MMSSKANLNGKWSVPKFCTVIMVKNDRTELNILLIKIKDTLESEISPEDKEDTEDEEEERGAMEGKLL